MKLIALLNGRKGVAESFTKENYLDQLEIDLKNYRDEGRSSVEESLEAITSGSKRYSFSTRLIFTNHESMLASMFDRMPDVVFFQSGKDDAGKELAVRAAYEYLKDKLDLETFMTDSAWWFILGGFVSAHVGYTFKTKEQPILNEETGEPTEQDFTEVVEDDPTIEVDDPFKVHFSPESEFDFSASRVPYLVRTKLMEVEEIKRIYGKEVKSDASIDTSYEDKNAIEKDLNRVRVFFYHGRLPKEVSGEVKGWQFDKSYFIVFTTSEILFKSESPSNINLTRLCRWHGQPNRFFGFGIAKLLEPFQREKSIRRGQQVRYADVAAYPKLILPSNVEFNKNAIKNPREEAVLVYDSESGARPDYLQAPNIGSAVSDANQQVDKDAQTVSGMMDISTGAQQTTVDTATGQTIFAEAAEKRMRQAKRKFLRFYREVVILLLKMAQENWQSDKLVHITGDDGKQMNVTVSAESLKDIDFDTDVDINAESVTINKEVIRQQAIAIYDRVKDDPLVNRKEVFKYMMENGFDLKNAERYMQDSQVPAGTMLVNPQTGEQFAVGESGELVSAEQLQNLRKPSTNAVQTGGQGDIAGGVQNVGI